MNKILFVLIAISISLNLSGQDLDLKFNIGDTLIYEVYHQGCDGGDYTGITLIRLSEDSIFSSVTEDSVTFFCIKKPIYLADTIINHFKNLHKKLSKGSKRGCTSSFDYKFKIKKNVFKMTDDACLDESYYDLPRYIQEGNYTSKISAKKYELPNKSNAYIFKLEMPIGFELNSTSNLKRYTPNYEDIIQANNMIEDSLNSIKYIDTSFIDRQYLGWSDKEGVKYIFINIYSIFIEYGGERKKNFDKEFYVNCGGFYKNSTHQFLVNLSSKEIIPTEINIFNCRNIK